MRDWNKTIQEQLKPEGIFGEAVDRVVQAKRQEVDENTTDTLDEELFRRALRPDLEYFDATEMLRAAARRIQQQDETIAQLKANQCKTADLLKRVANSLANLYKTHLEMKADLAAAGAFEKKSSLVRGVDDPLWRKLNS